METVSVLLAVLLALSAAGPAPARALYLYEEGPAAGYAVDDEPQRRAPAHRLHYVGGFNPSNVKLVNERAVDSYFRVLRPSPPPPPPPPARATEPPQPPQPHRQTPPDRAAAGGGHEEPFKQSRKEYFRKHSVYEKHTVVSRGNKRNGRRPRRPPPPPPPGAAHFYSPGAVQWRAGGALDGSQHYGKEYRKRNTVGGDSGDAYKTIGRRDVPARVGRHGPSAPYALFYRSGEAEAEGAHSAYYKGSASSYVDLNVGRKGVSFSL